MGRAWREKSTGSQRISQARMVRVYIYIGDYIGIMEKKMGTTIMRLYRVFEWFAIMKDSFSPGA